MARHLTTMAAIALVTSFLTGCGAGSEDSSESATVRVGGAYGEIEIPAEPKRIYADLMTVDYLMALGYDTSAIVGVFGAKSYAQDETHYLHDEVSRKGLADAGYPYEANVEKVAAANPDLILLPFDQIDGAENIDELRKVAPLLAVPTSKPMKDEGRYGGTASFQDWRGTLRSYGALLDRDDEAEAYIAATEKLLDEVRKKHADLIAGTSVVEAKSTPDYVAISPLTSEKRAIGAIMLTELGFRQPAQLDTIKPDEWGTIDISEENTSLLDADLLYLEVREGSSRHEESPLWSTLDVVKNDRVVTVGNHWEFGGAVGARQIIEDIDASLTELASAAGAAGP